MLPQRISSYLGAILVLALLPLAADGCTNIFLPVIATSQTFLYFLSRFRRHNPY
jgi:hypothetical protein